MKIVKEYRSFEGRQLVLAHDSAATSTRMELGLYLPPSAVDGPVPAVLYLSGLTCTWENVATKGGYAALASRLGVAVICPDTSPRGPGVPDDEAYDLGQGAGFYVDATQEPWSRHYRMYSYLTDELPDSLTSFPLRLDRVGIMGHSMGGHGALVIGLRQPTRYSSISALAPIGGPSEVPWGRKALGAYLGPSPEAWGEYDAVRLIEAGHRHPRSILVDQGASDDFLERQLQPERLQQAAENAGQRLELRVHPGYDHSYYFVASFMETHLRFHAEALAAD